MLFMLGLSFSSYEEFSIEVYCIYLGVPLLKEVFDYLIVVVACIDKNAHTKLSN